MQRIEGKQILVKLPDDLLAEVDRYAKRLHLSRAEMVRNLLDAGCMILSLYEGAGIVKMVDVFRRAEKTLRRSVGQQELFNGANQH